MVNWSVGWVNWVSNSFVRMRRRVAYESKVEAWTPRVSTPRSLACRLVVQTMPPHHRSPPRSR
ncbi:hypothetical protein STANM309S_05774 [Streptomyces tanashiensis]